MTVMNQTRLFRSEVFDCRKNTNYGSVLINTPVHYTVLTTGILMLVFGVLLFVIQAEFSEKFIVQGYLESEKGMARVYPSKTGVIAKCFIKQGDKIKKGDRLFIIDTQNERLDKKNQNSVRAMLIKKKQLIDEELLYKEIHLKSLKGLLEKKYISLTTYHEKHDEFIALEHQRNAVEVAIINQKHAESYVIYSPIDGVISSVIYHEGQYTNLTKPLIKIRPSESDLIAELYIPIQHSGFLHPNTQVILRYDAYPYMRFGISKGTIRDISRSILTDDEEDKPIRIGHPYYKVTALLDRQFVTVYGADRKIQQGMTISAVIVGSKRKIWQWILDPIYSFYGGVFL